MLCVLQEKFFFEKKRRFDERVQGEVNAVEEWRDLTDFPDYEISDQGLIRNKSRDRFLTPSPNGKGIIKVVLRKDDVIYTRSVARLVAMTFVAEPQTGEVVFHLDGDYDNVTAENLLWKPRWFAQKWAMQAKRVIPKRPGRIVMDSTGVEYANALECAKATYGIEEYIIICAGDPGNRIYNGSTYRWSERRVNSMAS